MQIPSLEVKGNKVTLLSDGKPFIMLAGEAHNSSSSSLDYMKESVWPALRSLNMNTLVAAVTWELLEPTKGQFDFTIPDGLIRQAEEEGMKLVFLWFGLWKNGMSTYVPNWVKENRDTYFYMRNRYGEPVNAISPLCTAGFESDAAAFTALMSHLKDFDVNRTVLMVQVENEMGLLGDCRDFSPAAEKAYAESVPADVAEFCNVDCTWDEAFGEDAPELFMTYYYAKATQYIAAAGKAVYPIPHYVNAWLEQHPWTPGTYPVGGPIARHMDWWKQFAPDIDFLSPDIYLPDFEAVCDEYTAMGNPLGNPLFIPEARPSQDSASNVFSAIGKYGAMGFSPFAIETVGKEGAPPDLSLLGGLNIMAGAFNHYKSAQYLRQSYKLLGGMSELINEYRCTSHMTGFTRNKDQLGTLVKFSKYDFQINYMPNSAESPKGGGLIIELSDDEFLFCGLNYRVTPLPKNNDASHLEYVSIEEGSYENNQWVQGRQLNGDEFRIMFQENPSILRCRFMRCR